VNESFAEDEPDDVTSFEFDDGSSSATSRPGAEQSPWPVVLVSGVALMIAALLLRWMVSPRAG
jgi:hypothetical protein